MTLNPIKLLQKLILVSLAILLILIVFENVYYQLSGSNKTFSAPSTQAPKLSDNAQNHKSEVINSIQTTVDDSGLTEATAIMLWWTPFIGELEYTKNCGGSVCFFTGNHKYFGHEKLKVYIICVAKI